MLEPPRYIAKARFVWRFVDLHLDIQRGGAEAGCWHCTLTPARVLMLLGEGYRLSFF